MRSPNDTRFQKIQNLMRTGMMVGADRPVGRVTWSKTSLQQIKAQHPGMGPVRYLDKGAAETELALIRTIEINRSIGQDAATCTITMWNGDPTSNQPEGIDTEGKPGYLTPGRGEPRPVMTSVYSTLADSLSPLMTYPTTWEYAKNPYRDVLIPNTVLKTYQGYGSDNFDLYGNPIAIGDTANGYVAPNMDTQLYLTGIWLIDKATFAADGTIQIECRDLAKLLIEQYIYPPMIPIGRFPLIYCPAHEAQGHKEVIGNNVAVYHSSSVDAAISHNASVLGHRGSDAFDGKPGSFWLSIRDSSSSDVEWLQARTHGPINEVVLDCWQSGYGVYVSVHEDGKWITSGSNTVPGRNNLTYYDDPNGNAGYIYVITSGDTLWDLAGTYYGKNTLWPIIARANSNIIKDPHWIYPGQRIKIPYVAGTKLPPPNGTPLPSTTLPYVAYASVPSSGKVTIHLPRVYEADFVRVSFTRLYDRGGGDYRAGVRTMTVRNHTLSTYVPSTVYTPGKIMDWTEPIKELSAWAGFTWQDATPNPPDPLLGTNASTGKPLRIWGDFETLGAGPVVCTPADYFMSKSFMDGIRQIVDFVGGIFYVDESGAVQFRLTNIWTGGNFIDDSSGPASLSARIADHPIEFHEDANLVTYQMTIDDSSLRSEILVIGGFPNVWAGPVAGGYVLGYNSATGETSAIDFDNVLAGQYRLMIVPGDATRLFYSEAECQRMAELTGLFILFTYRQGSLTAPCHPGLQLDDQVRIFERITAEQNIHYVSGIDSKQDLESGEYTMTVTTHWLGSDPNTDWFVNKQELTPAVKDLPAIIARVGREAGGDSFEQAPYGT